MKFLLNIEKFIKFKYLLLLYLFTIIYYYIYYTFININEKHYKINEIIFLNIVCFILIFSIYKLNE